MTFFNQLECDIESEIKRVLRGLGCVVFKNPAADSERPEVLPDLSVWSKGAKHHWFVELKTSKGRLSPGQIVSFKQIEAFGFRVRVIGSPEELQSLLNEIKEKERNHDIN